jgi:hypothetical protein
VSDMNQECQPKKKRIGSHSRSFQNRQCRKQPMSFEFHAFWFQRVTSSHHHHQTPSKFRNMLKPTSSCLVQFGFVGCESECAVLRMRLRNYIHRIQSPVLLLLIALLSTTSSSSSSGDNWLIYDRLLFFVCWIVVEGFIFTSSPFRVLDRSRRFYLHLLLSFVSRYRLLH